jgi:hypothetical protein
MPEDPEPTRQRRHDRGLTLPQQKAVDLLALGHSDTKVAKQVGVTREPVCRWRSHSPTFQAALNARRAALYDASMDRLRSMTERALAVLEAELKGSDSLYRWKTAIEVLKRARLPGAGAGIGDQDAENIVRRVVEAERKATPSALDTILEDGKGLPPIAEHLSRKWDELATLAMVGDAEESPR